MTDFALKFTDAPTYEAITRYVYEQLTASTLDPEAPTPRQGLSTTGTHWFVDEIGVIYEPTGEMIESAFGSAPVMTEKPGFYANLRWNGGDTEPPSSIDGMEIIWRSDSGEPLPDYWPQVIG